ALLIIDDIQAGCGRTGSYFSFDGMDLDPDIVTLAKGIGGFGTPLAMNLNKPEHDEHWSPGEHTGTFRGQGLSFVAGTEALSYFTDDTLMNDVAAKGEIMRQRLRSLADARADHGWDVRGRGMMQAVDVVDGAYAKDVQRECFERGLLIGPCGTGGRVLKLIPPLTIPEDELVEGLDILEAAIDVTWSAS
ncbi:MAG TPA: diaminobutyrate--2-oxoglutarate transaminase, partial [Acidimicrobiaceae bacterium]|nr:diaminobutyrate--2-oxoglutarate transaminase [Acidimicrobiaceae bacterium]